MEKNIMLAFVSPVSKYYLNNPINYPNIKGRPYTAIQTNEAAIIYVERMLGTKDSLAKIFLIASDSVQTDKAPPENEFGDVTHLEFLKRRVIKECPQLAKRFSVQKYSEGKVVSTALEKNILQTAEIADAIIKFSRNNSGAKIVIHADMTGGFRHASMLMLSIIQLLKYRGVEIGEVLYSDPVAKIVYSVTEIQRMFSLITGADEFVKFGSVEALHDYFGTNPPVAVKSLLEAMNRFSDAIKICRTNAIEVELQNLGQHIKNFREHPDKDLKSQLFTKIIDTIEQEYGNLISGAGGRLDIIRWCMKKGFWQQAMTLCTEWLPEEIVARKICVPKNSSVKKSAAIEGATFGRNWQQQLIIAYQGTERNFNATDDDVKAFCKNLREVLESFPAKKIADEEIFIEVKKFFTEHREAKPCFNSCCNRQVTINYFKKSFPIFSNVLQMIYDERKKNPVYVKNFYQFLQSLCYEQIPSLLANIPSEKLLELFKIEREMIPIKSSEEAKKAENKWNNRKTAYQEMFSKKIIHSALNEQTALKLLQGYHEIRTERNQVNHANAQASKKIPDLKLMIEKYLATIEKINP